MASQEELDELINDGGFLEKLHGIAKKKTHDEEEAHGAVMATVIEFKEMAEEKLEKINRLAPYIISAVNFTAIKYFKKQTKTEIKPFDETNDYRIERASPLFKMQFEEIEKAVSKYRDRIDNIIFNLHFQEGYTNQEIDKLLKKNPGYTKVKVCRLRKWIFNYYFQNE